MFFSFLPFRAEEPTAPRTPWVSWLLALLTVAVFAAGELRGAEKAAGQRAFEAAARHWASHPYLKPPLAVGQRLGLQRGARFQEGRLPPPEVLQQEQAQLDTLGDTYQRALDARPGQRLAFQPTQGVIHPGILTHVFVVPGWFALLGTLLFLVFVAPLLEATWGRTLLLALYFGGGAITAWGQAALLPEAVGSITGPWGALAACMGAFTVRFGLERVRIGYVYGFFRASHSGSFLLPAWLGVLLWASAELSTPRDGGTADVARLAHLASFGLGFVAAALIRLFRLEERGIAAAPEAVEWMQHPAIAHGQEALGRGDLVEARARFEAALGADARNVDAELGLIHVDLRAGEMRGVERLETMLSRLLAHGDPTEVQNVVAQLGDSLDPARLRGAITLRTAIALDKGPEALQEHAERFFAAAGRHPGTTAARSLLRAAEIRLRSSRDPAVAAGYLRELNQLSSLPPELATRIERAHLLLEQKRGGPTDATARMAPLAPPGLARRIPSLLEVPALPESSPFEPKVVRGRLLEVSGDEIQVESESGRLHRLSLKNVLAVGVGMTPKPTPDAPKRNVVVTDLVVAWGDQKHGPGVLRLESTGLRLPVHYPGVPPGQAYRQFLEHILTRSGANALGPSSHALSGQFPRFESESELNEALYRELPAQRAGAQANQRLS